MRNLGTLTANGESSQTIQLRTGRGFIAGTSTNFGAATVDVEWQASDGSWNAFTDAQGLGDNFQYNVQVNTKITLRVTVTGVPTVGIVINAGAENDDKNYPG